MHWRVLKFEIWWIQKLCSFIKKRKIVELETEERKIVVQLSLVKANKRSTTKEIKWLETELENIKNRKEHPLSINNILEGNIFPVFVIFLIFFNSLGLDGFTPSKAEQPLWGMELQEKKHKKDYRIQKICLERTYS